jgi:DNA-binding MarR family transcriptional regulator
VTTLTLHDYRAIAGFRRALRAFQRFSEEAARAAGVTPAQHQLLLAIRGHPKDEPPSVGDMADALQLRHHSTVELVDRAEAAGLVVREPDAADARRHLLSLTRRGSDVLERLSWLHRTELLRFRQDVLSHLERFDG